MKFPPYTSLRAPLALICLLAARPAHAAHEAFTAEIAQRESCGREEVLCLDDRGRGYAGDSLAAQLPAGLPLTVKVLGCASDNKDFDFTLTDSAVRSPDSLFREPGTDASLRGGGAPKSTCEKAADIQVLKPGQFIVSTDTAVQRFTITFSRVKKASGDTPSAVEAVESHAAAVVHGRYYLDVGVLIPVVVNGEREVVADDTEQANVKRLRVRNDVDVFPALMLHVFPGGRDRAALSSFARGPTCGPGRLDLQGCRADRHRRRAANSLGLQAGIELDFKKFSRFYFGGLFEPVTGFSINLGVALTRLQYIRGGYHEGALVPTTNIVHSDGSPDLSRYIEQRWAPRFYLGITLSIDILRYLGERRKRDELGSILPK